MTKYPEITVKLAGEDGNDFNILGICLFAFENEFLYINKKGGQNEHL